MCAINGITWADKNILKRMSDANRSRGPDHTGLYLTSALSLGHNLLVINSEEATAHQPRKSLAGSILAYNGQIYDVDAAEELDTVYLHRNLDQHGIEFLRGINGAFAIAWRKKNILYLARDHFGARPMFYARTGKGLIFSSTINGIIASGELIPDFSEENIAEFQRGNYWQNGRKTVYSNIFKLAPGEILKYDLNTKEIVARESVWDGYTITPRKFKHFEYRSLVLEAVLQTARSPQRTALLLSGGLDSNLIGSILGVSEIENFFAITLTYSHNPEMDESPAKTLMNEANWAKLCAAEHNIDHYICTMPGSQELVDKYSRKCLEVAGSIFEDSYRMIPRLFLLEQTAMKGAKVVLTGDGGDEVFSGYTKHTWWLEGFDTPTQASIERNIKRFNLKEWFPLHVIEGADPFTAQMFIDLLTQGETYFLRSDSFAGAFGMESRSPFIYQDLVKYVFELDTEVKFKYADETFRGINKGLIRNVFRDILPEKIVNRAQKIGWSLPYWRKDLQNQRNRMKKDQALLEELMGPEEP